LQVVGVERLAREDLRTPVHRRPFSTDKVAFSNPANHRVLSRALSRRQPLALTADRDGRKGRFTRLYGASIDRSSDPSYADLMNLQGPPELEAKLTRPAAETGRTADQVALDLLASSVDHDEWFRAEVEKGRAAAREGRLIEHDDVAARMGRRYRG